MPLSFFVWAVVGPSRTCIVDTGFDLVSARERGRNISRPVEQGLAAIGIDAGSVEDVIITHMHYDHAGNRGLFPKARYHIQDREMAYCTGRCMCHPVMNHPFDPRDVMQMVQRVFDGRVQFHDGDDSITPGLSVHHIGGHTDGLQVVRVRTARGWVVLASDAAHYYENLALQNPFPAIYSLPDMLAGYARIRELADGEDLIVPGHDPAVCTRFESAGVPGVHAYRIA